MSSGLCAKPGANLGFFYSLNAKVHRKNSRSAAQRNGGWFFRCNALLGDAEVDGVLNPAEESELAVALTEAGCITPPRMFGEPARH